MENTSVHGSHLMEISKQEETLTSSKFQVDRAEEFPKGEALVVLWMQWPWRKPQNPWPRAISTVRLVRSILRRTHQLLCLQGLGGRGAEHHLSSLGAAALRTSYFQLPRGQGEQGSVVPPLSSRTRRSSWVALAVRGEAAGAACVFTCPGWVWEEETERF